MHALLLLAAFAPLNGEIRVSDLGSLRAAVVNAKPGDHIFIAPGKYGGGVFATNVQGTAKAPVVIGAEDPKNPPTFVGAFQFPAATYLEVRDLQISGVGGNAMAADDAGVREKPSHHITFKNLKITDVPGGGSNGIKLAGVDDFRIENCTVERWGGCAIDMVGCHRGLIQGCRFEKGGGVGIQAKGSSSQITIRRCAFVDYGGRGVNIGGSTGIPFFRPPLDKVPAGSRYEAKDIVVEGCTFLRGAAPIAFAGADGSIVRFNTIYHPERWTLRILQETSTPDFVRCRNGVFENNLVVFRSDQWAEGGVNIGPNTAPETFRFSGNWWYCSDRPDRSAPTLPTKETQPTIGQDPQLRDPDHGDLTIQPTSPATKVGAHAIVARN